MKFDFRSILSLSWFLIFLFVSSASAASRDIGVVANLEKQSGRTVGNYRALIIGINDYEDSAIPDLKTAVNDATELSQVLTASFGFQGVVVLTDRQANESNIFRELRSLALQSKENDSVLIYYAGHGELDKITGSGYWVPQNAKGGDPSTYMNNAVIQQYIKAIPARHVLLIADSCFSGTLFGEARSLPPISNKFYATLYKERSRWGMTSGNLTPVEDNGENYYQHVSRNNPKGPLSGRSKVLRGGSWLTFPNSMRSADRFRFDPALRYYNSGFRCAQ
jgi:hypothetical protein